MAHEKLKNMDLVVNWEHQTDGTWYYAHDRAVLDDGVVLMAWIMHAMYRISKGGETIHEEYVEDIHVAKKAAVAKYWELKQSGVI